MENIETPLISVRQTGIRYGVILGLISVAYFMVLVLSGINTADGWVRWSGFIFNAALVVLGQLYFRQNGNGYMSFGQGMGIAFWIALISSVISTGFTVLYMTIIDPDFAQMIQDMQMESMAEQGLSDEQIEQGMKMAAKFTTPPMLFTFGVLAGIISTMLIALLTTFFTRKENPNMPE
jgi:Flp pilus assembly pilin Flp